MPRTERIISITSIPSRFRLIGPTLECLLSQQADKVLLYIPHKYKRFPDWDGELPSVPTGIKIVRCEQDYGPATKILPAANAFKRLDVQILLCDDDCIVPSGWAKRLFDIQARRPCQVVAYYGRRSYPFHKARFGAANAFELPGKLDIRYRALSFVSRLLKTNPPFKRPIVKSGYADVFFGVAGAVVKPTFFDEVSYKIPADVWFVDDIWLSATMARQGIKIYVPAFGAFPQSLEASTIDSLVSLIFNNQKRKELNIHASEYCRKAFGIW